MDLTKMISGLRLEQEQIELAIRSLERFVRLTTETRRARHSIRPQSRKSRTKKQQTVQARRDRQG